MKREVGDYIEDKDNWGIGGAPASVKFPDR